MYQHIHHEFAPIMTCLKDQISAGEKNRTDLEAADTRVREKADTAMELQGKILNVHFLLTLSGLADAYDQYGKIVNIAQKVHLLPHERLDQHNQGVGVLHCMVDCLQDHEKCAQFSRPDSKIKCLWPLNHSDKRSYADHKKIRSVTVVNQQQIRAAGLNVRTRQTTVEQILHSGEDAVAKSDKQLTELIKELANGLGNEVYDTETIAVIEGTRTILDLPALALKLREPGMSCVRQATLDFPEFKNSVINIPVRSLLDVPDNILANQFTEFVKRVKTVTKEYLFEDLKKVDPKEIIKVFLDPNKKLFEGVEFIVQAMAVSCVKHSCESVLESLVSKFENHFDERRNMGEESAAEEFEIAVNGPNLANCDSVVREAMDLHWKGKPWHFVKSSVIEQLNSGSTVLNRMNASSHLPIMN